MNTNGVITQYLPQSMLTQSSCKQRWKRCCGTQYHKFLLPILESTRVMFVEEHRRNKRIAYIPAFCTRIHSTTDGAHQPMFLYSICFVYVEFPSFRTFFTCINWTLEQIPFVSLPPPFVQSYFFVFHLDPNLLWNFVIPAFSSRSIRANALQMQQ